MLESLTSGVPVHSSDDIIMPDIKKTICITGHRDEKIPLYKGSLRYRELTLCAVRLMLYRYIDMAIECGYENFLCGLAAGTDIRAGDYIVKKREKNQNIKIYGVMPFLRHAERFSAEYTEALCRIEQNAELVVVTNNDPMIVYAFRSCMPNTSGSLYKDRNYFMVDHSSAAIAFLNPGERSGTYQTVNYAYRRGRKVVRFDTNEVFRIIDRCGTDIRKIGLEISCLDNEFLMQQ